MRPTILLVDDEPAIRSSVKRILRNEELCFLEAGDGQDALSVLDEHPVQLVLLDLQMPRMNGFEFLQRLRGSQRPYVTPVCVMTGKTASCDRERAIDLGADDFILKPAEFIELKTRIQSLLRIGAYQKQLFELNEALEERVAVRTASLQQALGELEIAMSETGLAYREMVLRLSLAAEMKDRRTAAHLERTSHYAALLARKCGWPEHHVDLFLDASKMHDIGKLGVPDELLNKPGKLTREEFAIVQEHTRFGARILAGSKSQLLQMAAEVALTHHERYDGTGYPQGLSSTSIPESGRIMAIADVFDVLMSQRPYKAAWSLEAAVAALQADTGRHFDPRLVELFLEDIDTVCSIHQRFSDDADLFRGDT